MDASTSLPLPFFWKFSKPYDTIMSVGSITHGRWYGKQKADTRAKTRGHY
jgi:hypothetical protein